MIDKRFLFLKIEIMDRLMSNAQLQHPSPSACKTRTGLHLVPKRNAFEPISSRGLISQSHSLPRYFIHRIR